MKRLRITGLVRTADQVRQQLSSPPGPDRLARLRRHVDRAIEAVDRILADNQAKLSDLPAPSRRAYDFLRSIDFDSIEPASDEPAAPAAGTIRFQGLRTHAEDLLDQLATAKAGQADPVADEIRHTSENIEQQIVADNIQPQQLTPETRDWRGWLALLAEPENLDNYLQAVARAREPFKALTRGRKPCPGPILVHFRPLKAIARSRPRRDLTRVQLPTPMICFDEKLLEAVADLLAGQRARRRAIIEAMTGEACQALAAELESLGGIVERTAGMGHDLADAFERVNRDYFRGGMPRPRLTWSRTFTGRKFGHYDPVRDTVLVSATLDSPDVPRFVVDFIVYHELLHKHLGVDWRNGRARAHTVEFREAEGRFERFGEAEAILRELGSACA